MQGNNDNNSDGSCAAAAAAESSNNNNNNNNNNISSNNNNNNDENNSSNNDSSNGNYSQSVTTTPTAVAVAVAPPTMAAPQQQQWLPMQYPPAFVVPHHMIPPPHYPPQYMPYHPHHLHHPPQPPHHHQIQQQQQQQHHNNQQQQQQGRGEGGSNGDNKTIWVGDLQDWMDEEYLRSCFSKAGEVSVKVIRNKQTGTSEGYGFVEFPSHAAAENVLQTYSCIVMPNADNPFRLNWATFSTGDKRGSNNGSDLSIFVGDLAADVTDSILLKTFSSKFPSVKGAKVVIDPNTGRSKGYGFVRFGDENEKKQAMIDMQGVYCLTRAMRIGPATPRKSSGYQQQYSLQGGYYNGSSVHGSQFEGESSNNTTIFVGGLDPNVSDKDLRQPFSQYGEIISVKIPPGKGCGFVQFVNKNDAEEALDKLNGTIIGKQTVRLSWGRNPGNKQSRADFGNQWTGAYYGGGHFYDGYGYALPPPHDPGMYAAAAAAYGAYPMYGTHQQQVS